MAIFRNITACDRSLPRTPRLGSLWAIVMLWLTICGYFMLDSCPNFLPHFFNIIAVPPNSQALICAQLVDQFSSELSSARQSFLFFHDFAEARPHTFLDMIDALFFFISKPSYGSLFDMPRNVLESPSPI